jgi:hypothetical protein
MRDFFQASPKLIFEGDADLMSINDDGAFDDFMCVHPKIFAGFAIVTEIRYCEEQPITLSKKQSLTIARKRRLGVVSGWQWCGVFFMLLMHVLPPRRRSPQSPLATTVRDFISVLPLQRRALAFASERSVDHSHRASALGFLTLIQLFDGRERYGALIFSEKMPSRPSSSAARPAIAIQRG